MSVRTITWAVSTDGKALIPATPQWGGVQGEDNATEVRFVIPDTCPLKGMSLYLETVDSTGAEDRTDILYLHNNGVSHPVPLAWTQNGGTTTVRLVAENAGAVAYTLESKLYFDNRQTARESSAGQFRSEIQKMYAEMRDMYNRINVMASEAGFVEGYADHLRDIHTGEPVYLWRGTKEMFEEHAPYLPTGTVGLFTNDPIMAWLEQAVNCGLGKAQLLENLDEGDKTGFYYCKNVTIDGKTFSHIQMHVTAFDDGSSYAHQTVHTAGNPSYTLHRAKVDGEWQPWEWENPPMTKGVIYRTTERLNNAPIYALRCVVNVGDDGDLDKDGKYKIPTYDNSVVIRSFSYTGSWLLPRFALGSTDHHQKMDMNRDGTLRYSAGSQAAEETSLTVWCYFYKSEEMT